ncbi:hypothetical protein SJC03_165 [Bacteroides phage SJC03]|nr:hypothetical protein SJC03_165 [Bacteroides phage SJC03]
MSNSNILKIGSLLNKFPNNGSKIELSKELKNKLVSVVSAYGKSNSDKDRDIIKDKTGKGNDFQILNADYKLNSSFGKYEVDFTTWLRSNKITDFDDKSFKFNTNESWVLLYHKSNIGKDTPSFKVHIEIEQKVGDLYYNYVNSNGVWNTIIIKSEEFETPISYNTLYTGETPVNIGFTTSGSLKGSITQIPSFQGAFTTDGIDDMIISTKTISEMGITDKITVVSMIHQIGFRGIASVPLTNYIRTGSAYVRNHVSDINKTGIYGYTCSDIKKSSSSNSLVINNILGDKNDYIVNVAGNLSNGKFSVQGYIDSSDEIKELSRVAWYWTFIAKDTLTTDEINQVIAYYNLDRPGEIVKPDILYDVKRQDITNENHAEFNDELIDFSGNNYNLKLYNMLWDKQSGIGNYPISFLKDYTYVPSRATVQVNKNSFTITSNSNTGNFLEVNTKNKTLPIYKVKVEGTNTITNGELSYRFNNTEGVISRMSIPEDGEYEIPESPSTVNSVYSGWCINGGTNDNLNIKITLLPTDDITNAVVLDGISSFGKVSNIPILKDYTVAALRKWLSPKGDGGGLISKSKISNNGAFIIEQSVFNVTSGIHTYSFGLNNTGLSNPDLFNKSYVYQTRYSYNGNSIQPGTGVDSDSMWLGLIRDNDARYSKMAIWSLLLFPYSLSEFLLERQLKKYKLGTLYPNQVEFRPIVNSNLEYKSIQYINKADGTDMVVGQYYPSDTSIQILITPTQPNKVNKITINGKEPVFINSDNGVYKYEWYFDGKSPQQIKLKLGIDETLVQFNPIINSNVEYKLALYYNVEGSWVKINPGDYITIGTRISIKIFPNNIDKLVAVNSIDLENISTINKVTGEESYYCYANVTSKSPQNIDIVIDSYIRYEDIVQPYPVVLTFRDINANEVYSWGSKIKVGSSIRVNTITNIIPELYSINSYKYGETYYSYRDFIALIFEVTRQSLEFSIRKTYKLGNNEPKTILSPERLSIPNSIYKILGYIPDLTGNGNHGKINNSTYVGMSGVNGYGTNLNNWNVNSPSYGKIKVRREEYLEYELLSEKEYLLFYNVKTVNNTFVIYANVDTHMSYSDESDIVANIPANTPTKVICPKVGNILLISDKKPAIGDIIVVKQNGLYEGSFCLDGVDDFITIPTLSSGGKQVLMKVNWNKAGILYDQRRTGNNFAIYTAENIPAYNARNDDGSTYIDGILNNNIIASDLINITHNLIVVNNNVNDSNTVSPRIGFSVYDNLYSKFALYDFMFFDDISSDEEIKELNDIIGIEDNIIEWNPTITSNISSAYSFVPNIRKSDGTIVGLKIGNIYLASITGNLVLDIVPPNKNLDEVSNVVIDGKSYTPIKYPDYYRVEIPLVFPNEINVIIDEYITYETIEQPYPIFLNYIDKETNKAYTWGDKVKVDSILKISGYKNLFENGEISLGGSNGYSINGSSELVALGTLLTSEILVNKINTGVKSSVIWNLDTPKPLFAYDPSIINNIGLKNLGYLPDITGQGRHLLLDGFAYEGMSGVNGYPVVLGVNKTWTNIITSDGIIWNYKLTSTSISIYKSDPSGSFLIRTWVISNGVINSVTIPEFKIKISNLKDGEIVQYHYVSNDNNSVVSFVSLKTNGIHTLPASVPIVTEDVSTNKSIGFTFKLNNNANVDGLTIEVLSNYEGSLYFDGVNDYGTVQNLTYGGKCLISKLNYNLKSSIIYDQRSTLDNTPDTNTFALYIGNNNNNVYSERLTGDVYINNVLNNYIGNTDLNNNTHVVTATCSIVDSSNSISPIFGRSKTGSTYAQFAMYRTILLPEVPNAADRAILNKWCGLPTGYLPKPEYYWDVTGKSNSDTATRNTIKNLGTAKPVASTSDEDAYSLENKNVAYEGMSGYNGYPVVFGANKTWYSLATKNYEYTLNQNIIHLTHINTGEALQYTYLKNNGVYSSLNRETPSFRLKVTGLDRKVYLYYRYIATSDATKVDTYSIRKDGIYNIPKQYKATDAINDSTIYVGIGIADNEGIVQHDCDITLEILPDYYGLCLDGITNYIECANIPAFTDYTYILMRQILSNNIPNSVTMHKGGIARTFISDYIIDNTENINKFAFYSFGISNYIDRNLVTNKIVYANATSVNGITIKKGTNIDNKGITIGKYSSNYRKMIFYKLMLWSRSINNTYHINMLRNLINNGGIIDLNNPIFESLTDKN